MVLELKNVGKIKNASIKLEGITVIAGENNTGKSTIGKMLYCVFDSFFEIEEQIRSERIRTISRAVANYYREILNTTIKSTYTIEFANHIIENMGEYVLESDSLQQEIIKLYLAVGCNMEKSVLDDVTKGVAERVHNYLQIKDEEIVEIILKKRLIEEFSMNISHLNCPGRSAEVDLTIKNKKINYKVFNNEKIELGEYISLVKDIIYIDDPFILDNINNRFAWKTVNGYSHTETLVRKLIDRDKEISVLDELVVKQKLDKIFKVMDDVCDGDLFVNDNGSYVYKTDKLKDALNMVNLSTGMKNFVVLKRLLKNGSIDENGIIIMDEPEIHLHPEWQLKFAEAIVLIQKEFNINILLNTHSPYFLNAIEVYSQKHGVDDRCNYYMTNEQNMTVNVEDVTDNIEKIYEKLAKPLQILENLEHR